MGKFLKMGNPQVIHDKTVPRFRIVPDSLHGTLQPGFNTNPAGILGATPTLGNTNWLLVGGCC